MCHLNAFDFDLKSILIEFRGAAFIAGMDQLMASCKLTSSTMIIQLA